MLVPRRGKSLPGSEHLRETIEVLSDRDAVRALADTEPAVVGADAVRQLVAARIARERR
jgi:hypothetical protein